MDVESIPQYDPEITPDILHESNLASVKESMPVLTWLRDQQKVMKGTLPEDHRYFPGMPAAVQPYYMNRTDPSKLGAWKIEAGSGQDQLKGRLSVTPGPEGIDYLFLTKNAQGEYEQATSLQEGQLASLLPFISSAA